MSGIPGSPVEVGGLSVRQQVGLVFELGISWSTFSKLRHALGGSKSGLASRHEQGLEAWHGRYTQTARLYPGESDLASAADFVRVMTLAGDASPAVIGRSAHNVDGPDIALPW